MSIRNRIMARMKTVEGALQSMTPSISNPSMLVEDNDLMKIQFELLIEELIDIRDDIKKYLKEGD